MNRIALLVSALACSGLAHSAPAQRADPAPPPPVAQEAIDAALDRGAAFLLDVYRQRAAKARLNSQERNGQTALSLYTMLKSGAPRDDATVRAVLHALCEERVTQTYDAACFALALYTHDPIDNRPWLDELAAQLVRWQEKDGDWSYPGGIVDLSNTQYAALGLWAASRAGVAIESSVWKRMAEAVLLYQTEDGGFGYTSKSKAGATGSMTAAGVGTLAIAQSRLRLAGALDAELEKRLSSARARGIEWAARRFTVETNPGSGGWHYYYLYGLERMGAVSAAPLLGPHDWYDAGSRWLLAAQDEKGSWNNGTDLSETCFALLFLRRATSSEPRRRGPVTGERPARETNGAAITISSEEADARGALRLSVVDWDASAMQTLEWPGERGKGPRVSRVEWLASGELVAVELGQPSRPAERGTFATVPLFRAPGKTMVRARAVVIAPDGAEKTVESQELEVEVVRALPAWLSGRLRNALDNIAPDCKPKARASSHAKSSKAPFGGAYEPDLAADGNARTCWLAAEGDEKRELSIQYSKSRRCSTIVVRQAVLAAFGPGHLSRPVEIVLTVNGKTEHVLALSPDPLQPAELVLDPPLAVKRLDLAVRGVAPSESCALVGIGEVELYEDE